MLSITPCAIPTSTDSRASPFTTIEDAIFDVSRCQLDHVELLNLEIKLNGKAKDVAKDGAGKVFAPSSTGIGG
jgi:hypothetical protein